VGKQQIDNDNNQQDATLTRKPQSTKNEKSDQTNKKRKQHNKPNTWETTENMWMAFRLPVDKY
jgi:hypothetical protein